MAVFAGGGAVAGVRICGQGWANKGGLGANLYHKATEHEHRSRRKRKKKGFAAKPQNKSGKTRFYSY